MAKKRYLPKSHLSSHDSFQFALHAAVLVVLIGIFITMVGVVSTPSQEPQGQTAGITTSR